MTRTACYEARFGSSRGFPRAISARGMNGLWRRTLITLLWRTRWRELDGTLEGSTMSFKRALSVYGGYRG